MQRVFTEESIQREYLTDGERLFNETGLVTEDSTPINTLTLGEMVIKTEDLS